MLLCSGTFPEVLPDPARRASATWSLPIRSPENTGCGVTEPGHKSHFHHFLRQQVSNHLVPPFPRLQSKQNLPHKVTEKIPWLPNGKHLAQDLTSGKCLTDHASYCNNNNYDDLKGFRSQVHSASHYSLSTPVLPIPGNFWLKFPSTELPFILSHKVLFSPYRLLFIVIRCHGTLHTISPEQVSLNQK